MKFQIFATCIFVGLKRLEIREINYTLLCAIYFRNFETLETHESKKGREYLKFHPIFSILLGSAS